MRVKGSNKEALNKGRRRFMKMALGTGMAASAGLGIPRFVKAKESLIEEQAKVVNTWCGVCGGNCGMKAYVQDGRVVHIAGNPADQAAQGRLCVKGHAAIRTLYDPDRLKYPMKRTNPKKGIGVDPKFVKITWDEAYDTIAEKFNGIKDAYGPESILFFGRSHPFWNRLGRAIGTPNFIAHQSTCFTSQVATWYAMVTGGGRPYVYDLENCKYILGFGFDGLGKSKNMHLRGISRALSRGAKMVILDPYMSVTAAKAHEWMKVKPGSDLAFTLAMIHVIVNENLYDRDFVQTYTQGFEHLQGFARSYTPQWAEEKTGIPAADIARIAREFATTKPAHIFTHKRDAAGPNYANSSKLAQAIIILNALVGTIDRRGGLLLKRGFSLPNFEATFPAPPYPTPRAERIDGWEKEPIMSRFVQGNFATIADGILNEKPYPAKAAIVRKYNVLAFPNAPRFAEALAKLDFVVTLEIYPSEMAHMSDIVLPEPYWLEAGGLSERNFHHTYPQIAARTAVVSPQYDSKSFGGIVLDIGRRMGLEEYFEGVSGGAWNEAQLSALGTSWEELSKSETGLWGDERPFTPRERFNTPSGKIELYSTVLEAAGFDPLPTWQPKREEPTSAFPYYFLINRPPMHKMTESQNNTLIMELYPENFAKMHSALGKKLGVRDGDLVYVESRSGKIKIKAKFFDGMRDDCVQVMHGFGHWSKDLTVAVGVGANDGDLIPDMTHEEQRALNDPGASAMMTDFCVNVYKA